MKISDALWKLILDQSKPSYKARKTIDGKLVNNVANFGLKKNQIAIVQRNGEYSGFSVKVLEDVVPLFTDYRISKAIKFLSQNKIQEAINVLYWSKNIQLYGLQSMYYALSQWLEKNEFAIPQSFEKEQFVDKDGEISRIALRRRSHPLPCKIEISDIGENKFGISVVPNSWIGKKFKSGDELHEEMNKLDNRKGKAPVSFCCIHSMMVKKKYGWTSKTELLSNELNYNYGITLELGNTKITEFSETNTYEKWFDSQNDMDYLIGEIGIKEPILVIICTNKSKMTDLIPLPESGKVGYKCSLLQKCIRRGRSCSKLLKDTIEELSRLKPYNLPDQQFAKVSCSRQLAWRLFITIIEDSEPYQDSENGEYLSLTELGSLAIMAQLDPDLYFSKEIVNKIIYIALLVQYNDNDGTNWAWRKGKMNNKLKISDNCSGTGKDGIKNIFRLCIKIMPKMSGDQRLLCKGLSYLDTFKLERFDSKSMKSLLKNANKKDEVNARLASYDMHCFPSIILHIQGSLSKIPTKKYTTKKIPGLIWDYSSRNNVRKPILDPGIHKHFMNVLSEIQCDYYNPKPIKINELVVQYSGLYKKNNDANKAISRQAFLLLFGRKIILPRDGNNPYLEVIISGTPNDPIQFKKTGKKMSAYIKGKEKDKAILRFLEIAENKITIPLINPPEGYEWTWNKKTISTYIKKDKKGNIIFYAENTPLKPFDIGTCLLPLSIPLGTKLEKRDIVAQSLYITKKNKYGNYEINKLLREYSIHRKNINYDNVFIWNDLAKKSPITTEIWRKVLVKIAHSFMDKVTIGPVDRSGRKLQEAISYQYEGTLWRLFNLLSFLYPNTVIIRGNFSFVIDRTTSEFVHMYNTLNELAFRQTDDVKINKIFKLKTKLWDNQQQTKDKIMNDITMGRKGFGDASCVGAGKTLSALSVCCEIAKKYGHKKEHHGFLVLIPAKTLFKTWIDEIQKHFKGTHIITQSANGKLSATIEKYSIVITTLGRMRDHPLSVPWFFVIIDECLSVQNREALQTEEAWRQVLCSKCGVLMMSATFFRSRFDKLFFLLKMLQTGLPENKDFLDTILKESVICNMIKNTRKWSSHVTRISLPDKLKKKYDSYSNSSIASDKMYSLLYSLLVNEFDVIPHVKTILENMNSKKVLIYTRSKEEADNLSIKIKNVSRYPDKSGKHCSISYAEGTFGLNDLVIYDTILTRPPEPDKLPQMKGRLDRPGQKNNTIHIEYFVAENTIEEAWLFRLELASRFHNAHILPLAKFYDLAVNIGLMKIPKKKKFNESIKKYEKIIDKHKSIVKTKDI
mgnify:CR=1 FL=1|jgi:hypothetical protein